jgi:hypothetical protein
LDVRRTPRPDVESVPPLVHVVRVADQAQERASERNVGEHALPSDELKLVEKFLVTGARHRDKNPILPHEHWEQLMPDGYLPWDDAEVPKPNANLAKVDTGHPGLLC